VIINADGRFKLLERPAAFPFKNIVTGTPDGPVFDLVDVEGYDGVVYITADHVVEMAHILGMKTGEEVEKLHEKIKELEAAKNRLPEGVGELVAGIDELVANYHRGIVSRSVGGELFDLSLPIGDGTEENGKSVPDAPVSNGQKPSASKRKGSNELPSNSVDEFGLSF